jgi:biotin carboxylase
MAVSALGLKRGAAHIEFIYATGGPVLMELGARCGGGHTPQIAAFVSGVHEFLESCRMACDLATHGFEPLRMERGADYRFLVFPPGTMKAVTIPDEVRNNPGVCDVDVTLRPGDRIGPLRTTADRAGFVVVLGKNLDQTSSLADWACSQVVMHYEDGTSAHASTAADFRAA